MRVGLEPFEGILGEVHYADEVDNSCHVVAGGNAGMPFLVYVGDCIGVVVVAVDNTFAVDDSTVQLLLKDLLQATNWHWHWHWDLAALVGGVVVVVVVVGTDGGTADAGGTDDQYHYSTVDFDGNYCSNSLS
jgi:hypothetical protein